MFRSAERRYRHRDRDGLPERAFQEGLEAANRLVDVDDLLAHRGITWQLLLSGAAFEGAAGTALALKLLLVIGMICFQCFKPFH